MLKNNSRRSTKALVRGHLYLIIIIYLGSLIRTSACPLLLSGVVVFLLPCA